MFSAIVIEMQGPDDILRFNILPFTDIILFSKYIQNINELSKNDSIIKHKGFYWTFFYKMIDLIDCCLMQALAVFQVYRGMKNVYLLT